jgi:hypothetical protein
LRRLGVLRRWLAGYSAGVDRFSSRLGFAPDDAEITIREDAPYELRGVIVDIAYQAGLSPHEVRSVVCQALRRREDPSNWSASNVENELRQQLDSCRWYEVYDIIEALYAELAAQERTGHPFGSTENTQIFEREVNAYMRREGIGWQLTQGKIETRGEEAFERTVAEARDRLTAADRSTAAQEIHEALKDLSRRPEPDRTGAIQHALAALECVARDATGESKATLGDILKRYPDLIPRPLDAAVDKLWGFASEQGRHLREGREPQREEAELAVHVSAAIIGYLTRKARPA